MYNFLCDTLIRLLDKMILEAPSPQTTSSSKVILQYVRMAS